MRYFIFSFLAFTFLALGPLKAQGPLITKTSTTTFFSHSLIEDIEAINEKTTAALNLEKSQIVVKMLIKHFVFENGLMQEHFNENYMESEKYPTALFKGDIKSDQVVDTNVDGEYPVTVVGDITIHGVTKPLECAATINVQGTQITASTEFIAKPKDFKIAIPALVADNIAKEIKVNIELDFSPSR